ncbi:MAG: hypothetical protein LBS59_01470, partial [Puniceicoccales bacterium]|nr:hypothetical protein [Puniceicoccales bacterium]
IYNYGVTLRAFPSAAARAGRGGGARPPPHCESVENEGEMRVGAMGLVFSKLRVKDSDKAVLAADLTEKADMALSFDVFMGWISKKEN